MYYFLKMVTEKSPVKSNYPLFMEYAKLEFHCIETLGTKAEALKRNKKTCKETKSFEICPILISLNVILATK